MNKIKKINRIQISYIILSIFLIALGIFNLVFPYIGMENLPFYTSMIFFLFAIFTFSCYMWSRKEGDYELLLLTITNIIVAIFLYLCQDKNVEVVLGAAIVAFYLQAFGVRVNRIIFYKKKKDTYFYSKITTTVLLTVLTILVAYNLFTATTVQTMLFGYYFIVYGIIWLLDSFLSYFVKTKTFKNYIKSS